MGSMYPSRSRDEETVKTVEGAFREIWAELILSNPTRPPDRDKLRVAVIHELLELIEEGVTDPTELKLQTLSRFTAQTGV